jgi:hypothetical protein
MFFGQALVRVRAGTRTDRGGNTVRDWSDGAVTRTPLQQVNVQPAEQGETQDAERDAVVTAWRVQSAPGTDLDVTAADRIEFEAMTCEVVGEVARWPDPFTGATHHVEFTIRRATG